MRRSGGTEASGERRSAASAPSGATTRPGSLCRSTTRRRGSSRRRAGASCRRSGCADPRAGALLAFHGGRGARNRGRRDHRRVQHRERDVRPDAVRRARRPRQGAVGRPLDLHPHRRRRRHRGADAAVRAVPPVALGVLRRHRYHSGKPERADRPVPAVGAAADAVRLADCWDKTHASDDRLAGRRDRDGRSAQAARPGNLRALPHRAGSRARDPHDGHPRRSRDRRRGGDGAGARHAAQHRERHAPVRRRVPEESAT